MQGRFLKHKQQHVQDNELTWRQYNIKIYNKVIVWISKASSNTYSAKLARSWGTFGFMQVVRQI